MASRTPTNVATTGKRRCVFIAMGQRGSGKTWLGSHLDREHFIHVDMSKHERNHAMSLRILSKKINSSRKHIYLDGVVDYDIYKALIYTAIKRSMQVVCVYFDLTYEDRLKNCIDAIHCEDEIQQQREVQLVNHYFEYLIDGEPELCPSFGEFTEMYPFGAFTGIFSRSNQDTFSLCQKFNTKA
jgi:hypothetical protein